MPFPTVLQCFISYTTLLAVSVLATTFDLPAGQGPYATTFSEFELTDHARQDPSDPSTLRRIMVSRFDPISHHQCSALVKKPYMSPVYSGTFEAVVASLGVTLPAGFFTQFQLTLCDPYPNTTLPTSPTPGAPPLIILSPGNGGTRLLYSTLAQDLASRGSTVLALDHTFNCAVVEFPNGDTVYGVGADYTFDQTHNTWIPIHTADISFLLTHLNFTHAPNASRAVVLGHSLGGATAITSLRDRRVRAAINLDGMVWASAQNTTLGQPSRDQAVVLWQQDGLDIPVQLDSWARFRATVKRSPHADFFAQMELAGVKHYSFTDAPVLFDVAGLRPEVPPEAAEEFFGTVSGERYLEIMGSYTQAFVDYVFGRAGGVGIGIYKHPPAGWEDVRVVF